MRGSWDSDLHFSTTKTCPLPSWHPFASIGRLRGNFSFSLAPQMISQGVLNEGGLRGHLAPDPYFPDAQPFWEHPADWHKEQKEREPRFPASQLGLHSLCCAPGMPLKSAETSSFVLLETGVKHTASLLWPFPPSFRSPFPSLPPPLPPPSSLPWTTLSHFS